MNELATPEDNTTKRSRRRWLLGSILAGGLVGSLATMSAGLYAQMTGPFSLHRSGHTHHGAWMGRDTSPEAVQERIDFATDWALSRVGATEDQRARVKAIALAAANDLSQARLQHRAHRTAIIAGLKEPVIDRGALEALRRAELQLVDSSSNRIVQAIADAAEVLTPEQRVRLAERIAKRHGGA